MAILDSTTLHTPMTIDPITLAFDLGWSSAKSELTTESNPYPDNDERWDGWVAGWESFFQIQKAMDR